MSEELDQLVHDYLHNKLSAEEKSSFEDRLKGDPELAEDVAIQQELLGVLGESEWSGEREFDGEEIGSLKSYFQSDESVQQANSIKKAAESYQRKMIFRKRIRYSIAASFALLVVSAILFILFLQPVTDDLNTYYSWNELPTFVDRSVEGNQLTRMETHFKAGEFNEAYVVFQSITGNEKNNADVFIYGGICLLELERYQEAMEIFDQLLQTDLLDKEKAYWYKALLYLRMEEQEMAKAQLELILSEEEQFFFEEASELMTKLP